MVKLYYNDDDDFVIKEFERKKVIDEIEMVMSAFNCIIPDDAGIYCSSEITTGKRFYYEFLDAHGVRTERELENLLGKEFKQTKDAFVQTNVARGVAFAERLRERGLVNVVAPGPFNAPDFTQQHYHFLWEMFLQRMAREIWFNKDWEYSDGCSIECAIAMKKGIPCLGYEGESLTWEKAVAMVEKALAHLRADGFAVGKLEQNLERLKHPEK